MVQRVSTVAFEGIEARAVDVLGRGRNFDSAWEPGWFNYMLTGASSVYKYTP